MKLLVACADPNDAFVKGVQIYTKLTTRGVHAEYLPPGTDVDDILTDAKYGDYEAMLLVVNTPLVGWYVQAVTAWRRRKLALPIAVIMPFPALEWHWTEDLLRAGADAVLQRPVDMGVVCAQIMAIRRRLDERVSDEILFHDFVLCVNDSRLTYGDEAVHLTTKEIKMVELLVRRVGSVITKEMFLDHLYGGRDEPDLRIIDVFICKIRRKFTQACGHPIVETLWGRGYRIPPDSEALPQYREENRLMVGARS